MDGIMIPLLVVLCLKAEKAGEKKEAYDCKALCVGGYQNIINTLENYHKSHGNVTHIFGTWDRDETGAPPTHTHNPTQQTHPPSAWIYEESISGKNSWNLQLIMVAKAFKEALLWTKIYIHFDKKGPPFKNG